MHVSPALHSISTAIHRHHHPPPLLPLQQPETREIERKMNSAEIQNVLPDFRCQPCGITIVAANAQTHLAGKKHRARCTAMHDADTTLGLPYAPVRWARQGTITRNDVSAENAVIPSRQDRVPAAVPANAHVAEKRWAPAVTGGGWRDRIKSQPGRWSASPQHPAPSTSDASSGALGSEGSKIYRAKGREICAEVTAANQDGEGSGSVEKGTGTSAVEVSESKSPFSIID